MYLCCPRALHNIFHTPMARYSLSVLKVPWNTNQPTNQPLHVLDFSLSLLPPASSLAPFRSSLTFRVSIPAYWPVVVVRLCNLLDCSIPSLQVSLKYARYLTLWQFNDCSFSEDVWCVPEFSGWITYGTRYTWYMDWSRLPSLDITVGLGKNILRVIKVADHK